MDSIIAIAGVQFYPEQLTDFFYLDGTTFMLAILFIGVIAFILSFVIYPVIRDTIWTNILESKQEIQGNHFDGEKKPNPNELEYGWSFFARTLGWNLHGIYFSIVHHPVFFVQLIHTIIRFAFACMRALYERYILKNNNKRFGGADLTDETIFDFIAKSTLVLLLCINEDGTRYIFSLPSKAPDFGPRVDCTYPGMEPRTLHIEFDFKTHKIVEAKTAYGKVKDHLNGLVSRNELVLAMLTEILGSYVHVLVHVASERCALEIESKRANDVRLSMYFVRPLHEGLHHGPLSPASMAMHPLLRSPNENISKMIHNTSGYPNLQHNLDERKRELRYFNFLMEARKVVFELVRELNIGVDSSDLFQNVVVHALDHYGVYQTLKDVPLHSVDGSGTLMSYWRAYCWANFWVPHKNNPLHSEYVKDHADFPFYRELYKRLKPIDEEYANEMLASCSF